MSDDQRPEWVKALIGSPGPEVPPLRFLTDDIGMLTPAELDSQMQRMAKAIAAMAAELGPMPKGEGVLIVKDKAWELLPLPDKQARVDGDEVHVLGYPTTWICPQCWSNADHGDDAITQFKRTARTHCHQCSQLRYCHAIEQQR